MNGEELFDLYPVVVDIPVAWGDMDAFNHVNNTMYFRYFETARIAYFERLDLMRYMKDTGIGPILASTQCRFKVPLAYPDRVLSATRIPEVGGDRFVMEYVVYSQSHQKTAAKGEGTIVTFDYRENRKANVPDVLKKRIDTLEGRVKS